MLVGGIDLSVGSVVLASATACGIGLAEQLPPWAALATGVIGRGGGRAAQCAAHRGAVDQSRDRHAGNDDRGPRRSVARAWRASIPGWRSRVRSSTNWHAAPSSASRSTPSSPSPSPLSCGSCSHGASSVAHGRRAAIPRSPHAWQVCGSRHCVARPMSSRGALAGLAGVLVAARTGLISPSIGAGLEFFAIAVVAARCRRPARRACRRAARAGRHADPDGGVQLHDHPGRPGNLADDGHRLPAPRGDGGGATVAARRPGRPVGQRGLPRRVRRDDGAAEHGSPRRRWRWRRSCWRSSSRSINPRFATLPNLVALVEQNAALAIVAVGAMIGIVSRTVDISPGSAIALGAVAAALAAQAGVPVPLALLAGVAATSGRLCRQRSRSSAASGSIR